MVCSKQQAVKIANPRPNGPTHLSAAEARRCVARRIGGRPLARFDRIGRLEFLLDPVVVARRERKSPNALVEVTSFAGTDALGKDRAVLPPSPEVLHRMMHHRAPIRPLRPPMHTEENN